MSGHELKIEPTMGHVGLKVAKANLADGDVRGDVGADGGPPATDASAAAGLAADGDADGPAPTAAEHARQRESLAAADRARLRREEIKVAGGDSGGDGSVAAAMMAAMLSRG